MDQELENFEKQLKELVETKVDEIIKESKAKSIVECARDESSIAKVNRAYDAKGLLMYLYMEKDFIPSLKLEARIKKYGLAKVFACICDKNNYFIEVYKNGDDLWTYRIVDELDDCLPVFHI